MKIIVRTLPPKMEEFLLSSELCSHNDLVEVVQKIGTESFDRATLLNGLFWINPNIQITNHSGHLYETLSQFLAGFTAINKLKAPTMSEEQHRQQLYKSLSKLEVILSKEPFEQFEGDYRIFQILLLQFSDLTKLKVIDFKAMVQCLLKMKQSSHLSGLKENEDMKEYLLQAYSIISGSFSRQKAENELSSQHQFDSIFEFIGCHEHLISKDELKEVVE